MTNEQLKSRCEHPSVESVLHALKRAGKGDAKAVVDIMERCDVSTPIMIYGDGTWGPGPVIRVPNEERRRVDWEKVLMQAEIMERQGV